MINTPNLEEGHVHIWTMSIDPTDTSASYEAVLAPSEVQRAQRIQCLQTRQMSLFSRANLRRLLAQYIGIQPAAITFSYGTQGKPLLQTSKSNSVSFNVSHSGDKCVIAFSRHSMLGVDVEAYRQIEDAREIAHQFFTADECESLVSVPTSESSRMFLTYWTRKEAVLKATGLGLQLPLDSFQVNFPLSQKSIVSLNEPQFDLACNLDLHSFFPFKDCVGSLATEGPIRSLRYFESSDG